MKWTTRVAAVAVGAGLLAGCAPDLPMTMAAPDQGLRTQQVIIGDPGPFGFGGYSPFPWGLTDPWFFMPPYYSSLLAGAGWGLPFGLGGIGWGGYGGLGPGGCGYDGIGYGGYGPGGCGYGGGIGYSGYSDVGFGGFSRGRHFDRGHPGRGRSFDRGHADRGRSFDRGHAGRGQGFDRGHRGASAGRNRGIAEQNSVAYRPSGSKIWRSKK